MCAIVQRYKYINANVQMCKCINVSNFMYRCAVVRTCVGVWWNTSSSETTFIPNHFHPKTTFSSQTTFIPNHFHPKPHFHPKTTFIQHHFHPKPLSSHDHFHPKPLSSHVFRSRKVGHPRGGGPKGDEEGLGPEGWAPKGGGPKISRFFPSRHIFLSFFSLLGVFSWNFGGV